ncbi:TIGR04452 family lipoprotein [Leptospira wolffii]|uniref:Lipoprotein n=1 Tax=Leptospira wolffii TaxID=409998 RepID=A0A2M9Z8L9_9LEPT|nr:TIGR04452 family lipoprotein [Leptospira wolffii]EPG67167.1 hypothetical protein LEP1GSC061_1750 [Leptospira wolffii serovar Khorat str. Khorat-H2]PJZ64768.1 lipoprotein [Leptospira wolffii]TGK56936.1 TIGR04452 family lipoprotein [Leptospira wolffii]TGK70970.1 TIGR04452 family lipoprotein [Leptospira wolffii]TGK75661.1 TIGR04452 family lipoprotein [Leptospira wolffii]
MRLKFLLVLILVSVFANCALLNRSGLTDRYKGKEAQDMIQDAATTSALIYAISTGDYNASVYTQNILLPTILAGIKPSEYYVKADIDSCVSEIKLFGVLGLSPTYSSIFGQCSNLQPEGTIYGDY